MTFPQALARAEQAIFERLGEPATWNGAAVRVRRPRDRDEDFRMDFGELVVPGALIKVRQSEVEAPAEGQEVQLLDEDGNALADGLFTVAGEPKLDRRKGVWTCQVKPVPAA